MNELDKLIADNGWPTLVTAAEVCASCGETHTGACPAEESPEEELEAGISEMSKIVRNKGKQVVQKVKDVGKAVNEKRLDSAKASRDREIDSFKKAIPKEKKKLKKQLGKLKDAQKSLAGAEGRVAKVKAKARIIFWKKAIGATKASINALKGGKKGLDSMNKKANVLSTEIEKTAIPQAAIDFEIKQFEKALKSHTVKAKRAKEKLQAAKSRGGITGKLAAKYWAWSYESNKQNAAYSKMMADRTKKWAKITDPAKRKKFEAESRAILQNWGKKKQQQQSKKPKTAK